MIIIYKRGGSSTYDVCYNDTNIGTFIMDIDGFYYYEPNDKCGLWSEDLLCSIVKELKSVNKDWRKYIKRA